MNIADRIQFLRKSKGVSQEELAEKIGVSRQAVSKWESEQSTPELENIIIMSDFFGVTTDYILKGIETEPKDNKEQQGRKLAGNILYIVSTAIVFIGLFCAFCGYGYAEHSLTAVWGSMIIQAVGIVCYGIGKVLSSKKAPFCVDLLNITGVAFMPVSMITGYISERILHYGGITPYPSDIIHLLIFGVVFAALIIMSCIFLKKQRNSSR